MSKKEENKKKDMLDIYLKFKDSNDFTDVGKLLGKGAFGEVRDIKFRNKTMAGKLIERENSDQQSEEEKVGSNLRGQNIIKINKSTGKISVMDNLKDYEDNEIDDQPYYKNGYYYRNAREDDMNIGEVFDKLKAINKVKDNLSNIQDDFLGYHQNLKTKMIRINGGK